MPRDDAQEKSDAEKTPAKATKATKSEKEDERKSAPDDRWWVMTRERDE
ncbi:hypothetical protein [Micromonospora sp. NPDC004704]